MTIGAGGRRRRTTTVLVVSLLGFAVSVGVVLVVLVRSRGTALSTADSLASVTSAFLGAAALAASIVTVVLGRRAAPSHGDLSILYGNAATTLALRSAARVQNELSSRRLLSAPIAVHWENSAARAESSSGTTEPLDAGGVLDLSAGALPAAPLAATFRRMPEGRLVIRGAPGSGKTVLAMLFTQAALDDRRRSSAAETDGNAAAAPEPVPVFLSLGSWRPDEYSVRTWVTRQIYESAPELADARRNGEAAVEWLFDQAALVLVLDGLDEIADTLRDEALRLLGDAAGVYGLRMVITCRDTEYRALLRAGRRLPMASEITIGPVAGAEAMAFLAGDSGRDRIRWSRVDDALRNRPEGPLAAALSTPLMIFLARSAYRSPGRDPGELLSFRTGEEIESHLLSQFLPTVYPDPESAAKATRWLGTMARHLQKRLHQPVLAWWELAQIAPTQMIAIPIGAVTVCVSAAAGCLVRPFPESRLVNFWIFVSFGLAFGVLAALLAIRGVKCRPWTPGGPGVAPAILATAARDALAASVALTAGSYFIPKWDLNSDWDNLTYARNATTAAAVAAAISLTVSALSLWRSTIPARPAWQPSALIPRLASALGLGLLLGGPIGLLVALVGGLNQAHDEFGVSIWDSVTHAGAATGIWTALAIATAVGVPVGVGRWLAMPADEGAAVSARTVLRADRTISLTIAACAGISAATACAYLATLDVGLFQFADYTLRSPVPAGVLGGLAVFVAVLIGGGSPWATFAVSRSWLSACGRLPWHTIAFLEDAHARGVLRRSGASYQFRHDRLERHLAELFPPDPKSPEFPESREYADVAELRDEQRTQRAYRIGATIAAVVLVPATAGVVLLPGIRDGVSRHAAKQLHLAARQLTYRADAVHRAAPDDALRLRIAAAEIDPEPSAAEELTAFLRMRADGDNTEWAHTAGLTWMGDWIIALTVTGSVDGWLLSAAAPARRHIVDEVEHITSTSSDRFAALTFRNGDMQLLDIAGGTPRIADLRLDHGISVLDANDRYVVTKSPGGEGWLWDVDDVLRRPRPLGSDIVDARLGRSGRWAAVRKADGTMEAVDMIGDQGSVGLGPFDDETNDLEFRGAAAVVAFEDRSRGVDEREDWYEFWDLDSSPPRKVARTPEESDGDLALDGKWLAVTDDAGVGTLHDLRGAEPRIIDLGTQIREVQPTRGRFLVIVRENLSVEYWDLRGETPEIHRLPVRALGQTVKSDDAERRLLVVDDAGRAAYYRMEESPPQRVQIGEGGAADATWADENHVSIDRTDGLTEQWELTSAGARLISRTPTRMQGPTVRTVESPYHYTSDNNRWGLFLTGYSGPYLSGPGLMMVMKSWDPLPEGPSDAHEAACRIVNHQALSRDRWKHLAANIGYHRICAAGSG
ncbi:NACHT domain-containing protein [Actinoplanes sp. CA-131856]